VPADRLGVQAQDGAEQQVLVWCHLTWINGEADTETATDEATGPEGRRLCRAPQQTLFKNSKPKPVAQYQDPDSLNFNFSYWICSKK
jgi:hypothetical protein